MGRADTAVKNWLSDKSRFADSFNGILFAGTQVITAEELTEVKGEADIILRDKEEKDKTIQRYRDIIMHWEGGIDLVLLAAEVQDKVHYAMPVKNMVYDSLSYAEQIRKLWKEQKEKSENVVLSKEEFLSGFRKDDRIFPVITLVFYYDEKEWDGAKNLYDMMGISEKLKQYPELKQYIPNYHINLVDAGKLDNVERFHTDLQAVLGMLRYRKREDRNKLKSYVEKHKDYFSDLDSDSYYALSVFLKSDKLLKQVHKNKDRGKEAHLNMCEALEGLYEDGIEKGIEQGRRDVALNLHKMGMTPEKIAEAVNERVSVVEEWLKQEGSTDI